MVDRKTVEYVAHLARVDISEQEKDYFAPQLSTILDYIDKLNELSVERIQPTRGAFTEENILREDRAKQKSFSSAILNNAPSQENNQFKIPRVIE